MKNQLVTILHVNRYKSVSNKTLKTRSVQNNKHYITEKGF